MTDATYPIGLTPEELERLAYVEGDMLTAGLAAQIVDLTHDVWACGDSSRYDEGYHDGYNDALENEGNE